MLVYSILGLLYAAAIVFLLYAYRGFAREQKRNRPTQGVVTELKGISKEPPYSHSRRGLALLFFASPSLCLASLEAQIVPPTSLPLPAMVGPLSTAVPVAFDAGPFGQLDATGVLSGFGDWENHPSSGDHAARVDIGNGQVFVQKPSGIVQFYLQAGVYNLPAVGTPTLSTRNTLHDFFGPLPLAYLTLAPKGSFSVSIGKLPTLFGAEDTFTFENLNIERGLLWNQEPAVSRGLQINYSKRKLNSSLAWNDGFYSNRYNWVTGALTYSFRAVDSIELVIGGHFGYTGHSSAATPLFQNNSTIYDAIYTHAAKQRFIETYLQYTNAPRNTRLSLDRTTATLGEAVLENYTFNQHLSMAGRIEYIGSTGNLHDGSANLIYGPGSRAASVTMTPTYQNKSFFARGEFSFVHAFDISQGDAFGPNGRSDAQLRGVIETGFLF